MDARNKHHHPDPRDAPLPTYLRVSIDNPPLNVIGPAMVREFQDLIDWIEADDELRVVVFDSGGVGLNHSDFMARLQDLTSMPPVTRGRTLGEERNRHNCAEIFGVYPERLCRE